MKIAVYVGKEDAEGSSRVQEVMSRLEQHGVSLYRIYDGQTPEADTDMLELYILDHTSMSFMPELESGKKYGTEKPVATEPGMYLTAGFRKTM